MDLREKTVHGIRWMTFSTVVVTILQMTQMIVLTRFLDPVDFGLMAIVSVVIGFAQVFIDMGVSNAIVHRQAISREQLSSLYWLNIAIGIGLSILVASLSPIISTLYKENELSQLLLLASLIFLIQPFGQQFMMLMQKEMLFRELAIVDVSSKTVALLLSVAFSYLGYGVYSLVYSSILSALVQSTLYLVMGKRLHWPLLRYRTDEVREFLSYGAYQTGEKSINYFSTQIDVIVIGKVLGAESLGIYTIAKQLIMRPAQLINPIITKVSFPAMAKIQDDILSLRRVYLKTINYLSSVNFAIYAGIIVFASDIVLLLFGEKWSAAIPIVQILSIYGAIRSTINPIGSLLLARGRVDLGFYWNLSCLLYTPICMVLVSPWGLEAASWALVAIIATLVVPNWYYQVRPLCGASFIEYHLQIAIPAAIAAVSGLTAYVVGSLFPSLLLKAIFSLISAGAVWLMLNSRFNRDLLSEIMSLMTFNRKLNRV